MKDGEVSLGECIAPFVTPALKAAIDFPFEKNGHIINLFVYSASEPREGGKKIALFYFSERHPFLSPNQTF